jgi:hypothetical protein
MKTGFLQLLGVILFSALRMVRLDVAPPPTEIPTPLPVDVAPPTSYLGLGLGVLAALCCLVLVVAVVAFFVIRAIKKNSAAKNNS